MTYAEYQKQIEERTSELGITKNEFYTTEEYKAMYPKMMDQYSKEYGQYKRIRRKRKDVIFGSTEFYAMLFVGP